MRIILNIIYLILLFTKLPAQQLDFSVKGNYSYAVDVIIDGKFSTVFNILPQEAALKTIEHRHIAIEYNPPNDFVLNLKEGYLKTYLTLPGQEVIENIENKILTGQKIVCQHSSEKWESYVLKDSAEETIEVDKREMNRLSQRFHSSNFIYHFSKNNLLQELHIESFLRTLGFTDLSQTSGVIQAKRASLNPDESISKMVFELEIDCQFTSGDGISQRNYKLKAKGNMNLIGENSLCESLKLQGDIVIHGYRLIEKERKVPFSIIGNINYVNKLTKIKDSIGN